MTEFGDPGKATDGAHVAIQFHPIKSSDPGDLVSGDLDGAVIVPRALEAEVVTRAMGC